MTFLNRRSRRGFTLAELLIVISLLAVLAGIAFLFFNPKEISYVEYNRSAEAIATAVQNRLTEIRNAGDMSTLRSMGESATGESVEGGYRYVFDDSENIGYILPFGSIESEIAAHHFAIGFQSDTGIVGEVFYGGDDFAEKTVAYLLSDLGTEEDRKAANVGFYEGDFSNEEIAFANLPTPQLTITNYEELSLSITIPKVKQLEDYGKKLGIVVSLYDEDRESITDKNHTLNELAIYSTFSLGKSSTSDSDPVIKAQTISTNQTYTMVLDTVRKYGSFSLQSDFGGLADLENENGVLPKGTFEQWASHSLAFQNKEFLLGDNNTITVTVYCMAEEGDGYDASYPVDPRYIPRSASVVFNGWFNKYKSSSVEIACGRHLQNLGNLTVLQKDLERYLPTYSDVNNDGIYEYGDYNYGMASTYTDGSSNGDPVVDYDEISEKYDRRSDVKSISKATQINAIDFNCKEWTQNGKPIPFTPINLVKDLAYYGNYLTISHLYVDAPFYAGLFGYSYHAKLYDILLVNPSVTSQMPAHLSELYEMGVGALIGTSRHSSEICNCQVYMTQESAKYDSEKYRVTGECYVGGLIGFCEDEDIENCSASVYTGFRKGAEKTYESVKKNSVAGESETVQKSTVGISSKYVGGLIGCITGDSNINSCYAAGYLTGDYVGGLIGLIMEDSDPSGDDYRIQTCYAAGHIEYASKSAAGILGYISELAGNAKSAVSVTKNYAVVIYGEKSGGTYSWNSSAPIYGTFRGDGFEWLLTDSMNFSDTYLTGSYAGETYFAGAVFKKENRNYYIAQKGITYNNSPYYNSMKSAVEAFLSNITGSEDKTQLEAKIQAAKEQIVWLKKLQALEDLKLVMENLLYQVDSETGLDHDGVPYNEAGFYEYGRTVYLDKDRIRVEGYERHDSEELTVVQALHVIYDGTYTNAAGEKVTVSMKYVNDETNEKENLNDYGDGGVYTFMDYYNLLKETYETLANTSSTAAEKETAKETLKTFLGDNSRESYIVQNSEGKDETRYFYQDGYFYKYFYSDLLYRLMDKAKDYYQETNKDKFGELVYRHFRSDLVGKFLEGVCDLGMSYEERDKFLQRTKLEGLDEAIETLSGYSAIIDKWTGKAKADAANAKNYVSSALTALKTLRDAVAGVDSKGNTVNVTQAQLTEYIKNADGPLYSLYELLDKYKAQSESEDKGDWDAVDSKGTKGDLRALRDPVSVYRRTVALCKATANSSVENALDELAIKLKDGGAISTIVEEFKADVNTFLGTEWSSTDSGHRLKNAQQMRDAARGFLYGEEREDETRESLGFMYDYYNESSKNPYPQGSGDAYVDQDNGVYNNVFPYEEGRYTGYYPFPFVYGKKTENNEYLAVYVLFHYGDWLTQDLWADEDPALALLDVAPSQMTAMKQGLEDIQEEAGKSGSTGNINKEVKDLGDAIQEVEDIISGADSSTSGLTSTGKLDEIRDGISGWLADGGEFSALEAICKKFTNKGISQDLIDALGAYRTQLEQLIAKIDSM